MSFRIVINGREVINPFARFGIAALGMMLLFVFALFILFVVLPLVGLTLALTTGIILAVFIAALLTAFVYSMPFARRWRNDKRRLRDRR
jgi:hypothetical protein